jgi:hypothetical protein
MWVLVVSILFLVVLLFCAFKPEGFSGFTPRPTLMTPGPDNNPVQGDYEMISPPYNNARY